MATFHLTLPPKLVQRMHRAVILEHLLEYLKTYLPQDSNPIPLHELISEELPGSLRVVGQDAVYAVEGYVRELLKAEHRRIREMQQELGITVLELRDIENIIGSDHEQEDGKDGKEAEDVGRNAPPRKGGGAAKRGRKSGGADGSGS